MLCRNLLFLKSNQYSRSESSNSRYIFVFFKTRLSSTIAPHFSLIKFLARRLFRQILKLSFFPVFTILSATFVLYFQTTYYRHVAGAGITQAGPAVLSAGAPYPPTSHTAGEQAETYQTQPCVSHVFLKMYLKSICSSGSPETKMRYISLVHPTSGRYHIKSNTCVYT